MRVHLAQINTTVGDIRGNLQKILNVLESATEAGADLAVFPELALTGYPPRDLLEKRSFVSANLEALDAVARASRRVAAIVGYVEPNRGGEGKGLFNAAAVCQDGRIAGRVEKSLLPAYDVFDEDRHFEPGKRGKVVEIRGRKVGLSICEDAWNDAEILGRRLYDIDPIAQQVERGAEWLVNISASPFALGRPALRERLLAGHAARHGRPLVHVNLVGGNDELLFDGRSVVFDAAGRKISQLSRFREENRLVVLGGPADPIISEPVGEAEEVTEALVMGLRDYAAKCSFTEAVIGLSGGIDSSVVAALAAESLGPHAVTGVSMPSRYSSPGSVEDAARLAENLGIRLLQLPIEEAFSAFLSALRPCFEGRAEDVTEENLQARIRGTLLMALSNKFGWLVLTTGNKSELAVGYTTLYGDMSGGLAVISDVPKTLVYEIARTINRRRPVIPESVLTKPPSAELRAGQRDQDSLPPYEMLDPILRLYVEEQRSAAEIVNAGFPESVVLDVIRRVDRSEYKRKQAPPGLRVTAKAFGLGRRMPIAQRYSQP